MRLGPWLAAAALAGWAATGVAAAGRARGRVPADTCRAPAALDADRLVAAGRFWHASRVAPPLPAPPREPSASVALLRLRIAEGLGRGADVDAILARLRGADTIPEALAIGARNDERAGRWATAAARWRRLSSLPGARPAERAAAAARLAVALQTVGDVDSAEIAWRRAAQALPDLADWFAVRRAALEPDTALAFASVAITRSRGASEAADALVASRRLDAGNVRGALTLFLRHGNLFDAARAEARLGLGDVARYRMDALLTADPARPAALLAANVILELWPSPSEGELLGIARAR